jgi:hypothetical protein
VFLPVTVLAVLALSSIEPALRIEAPLELAHARSRLEQIGPGQLADVAALIGPVDADAPVRVVLATEASDWAQSVPAWTAGFAVGGDLIVLFPARSPVYPHGTLEDVLRHELAHVLIARATGGQAVPRWFNEGLAMAAERPWGLVDRSRLAYELAFGPRLALDDVDRLFGGSRRDQSRAYAVAGWFVGDLLHAHGAEFPAQLLARMGRGVPFADAYARTTGVTLVSAEADFWRRQRTWTTWFPVITSTTVLWTGITLLALYAARRRRRRREALHRRWAEEEAAEDLSEPPG